MKYNSYLVNSIIVIFLFMILSCSQLPAYDMVISNGYVLNFDTNIFEKKNIGATDGKIIVISADVLEGKSEINAEGQFIYPGFIDAHCHFWYYATGLLSANLVGTKSLEEVVQRLSQFESKHPDLEFIIGRGWDQNDWTEKSFPNNELLSQAFPDKQVFLTRIDGHAMLVNQRAIEQLGELPDMIEGGEIIRVNGVATGIFVDKAKSLFEIPRPSLVQIIPVLVLAEQNCFRHGLTGLADAGLPFHL